MKAEKILFPQQISCISSMFHPKSSVLHSIPSHLYMEGSDIQVTRLHIHPITSPLDNEVQIQLEFDTPRPLSDCEWKVQVVPS